MRNLLILLAVVLWALSAAAQTTFNDPLLGQRPGAFSARTMGLGHAFLTDQTGPGAIYGNPATMAAQNTRWLVEAAADVSRVTETRKYPVYDSFDAVLIYNNYAINDHLYSKLDGGVAYKVPTTAVPSLVISAASYSTYRFDYRYHEEVRDRYTSGGVRDLKLGENRIDITGDLRSISFGAATQTDGPLAAGFSVNLLSGSWNYSRGIYYADSFLAERFDSVSMRQINRIEYEPEGTPSEFIMGATFDVSDRVTVGGRVLFPTGDFKIKQHVVEDGYAKNVDSTVIASGSLTVPYPAHFGLGVRYRPQNEFRPILLLEGEIHTYNDVSSRYDDTFEIRAGAEQQVVAGVPVRVGFVYASAPEDKERASSLFTAGIGFTLQKLSGDFGMEVGRIQYSSSDLFPQHLYGDPDRTDKDKVETSLFRGLVTLRYAF